VSIEDEQASIISMTDRRRALLTAALGFLELPPRAPELRLLHWWLDRWMGVGLITVGVERLGYRPPTSPCPLRRRGLDAQ